jgi:hypothetical protein
MGAARWIAAVVALIAAVGLILQFVIFAERVGIGLATWRYFGFFTILSNIAIAAIAAAIALGSDGRLTSARSRLMGLTAIVTVGFVYSILLRSLWNPTGLQKVVDMILHDLSPLLYAVLWALLPHGSLTWGDLKWALTPPALYLGYALARGEIDNWYPYYFINPNLQSTAELIGSILGVLIVFAIVAGGAIAVDMRLGRRQSPSVA